MKRILAVLSVGWLMELTLPAIMAADDASMKFGRWARGDAVVDFKAVGADGKDVSFASLRGKPVLVAFCNAAGPRDALLKLHEEFREQGLVLLAIFTGTTPDGFQKWVEKNLPADGMVAMWDAASRSSPESIAGGKFGLGVIPATGVIDRDGKIVGGFVGFGSQSASFATSLLVSAGLKAPEAKNPPSGMGVDLGPPPLEVGAVAPDFALIDAAGRTVKLSDYTGKVVVIDFWATWCGPCIASMPHTETVAAATKSQDVVVLAAGTSEAREPFESWVKANASRYPTLVFAHDPAALSEARVSAKSYRVRGIPTQFVIGRDGKVAASIVGYGPGDTRLEEALKALGIKF